MILDIRVLRGVGLFAFLLLSAVIVALVIGAVLLPWPDGTLLLLIVGPFGLLAATLARRRVVADPNGLRIRGLIHDERVGWNDLHTFCIEQSLAGPVALCAITTDARVIKLADQRVRWATFGARGDDSLNMYQQTLNTYLAEFGVGAKVSGPTSGEVFARSPRPMPEIDGLPWVRESVILVLVRIGVVALATIAVGVVSRLVPVLIAAVVLVGFAITDIRRFPPGRTLLAADADGLHWFDHGAHQIDWDMVDCVVPYGSGPSHLMVVSRDGDAWRLPVPRKFSASAIASQLGAFQKASALPAPGGASQP